MTTVLSSNVQACASRRNNDAIVSVAQFSLSQHRFFRAEIVVRGKKSIVSVARWKNTPNGARRTGQAMEFGAHRIAAIVTLLTEVQRLVAVLKVEEARHESGL